MAKTIGKEQSDIRNFFARSQAPKMSSAQQRRAAASAPKADSAATRYADSSRPFHTQALQHSSSPSSPSPPAAAATGSPTARVHRSRDAVIAASDDDLSDSGDSLPDFHLLGSTRDVSVSTPSACLFTHQKQRAAQRPSISKPPATPRRKQIAVTQHFHSSPLTIQSKRKMADIDALLEFVRKDEEMKASAQRFSAMLELEADTPGAGHWPDDKRRAAAAVEDAIRLSAAADAGADEGGADEVESNKRKRIMRALERTDAGATSKQYYFFEQTGPETNSMGKRFPRDKAAGVWVILRDPQDRARHFASGLPYDIQTKFGQKFGSMPDEIFLWVMDEVCSESRRALQFEYVKLLGICDDQIYRLVTPALLQRLFRKLGATNDVDNLMGPVTLVEQVDRPYANRDWSCVETFLDLLGKAAASMSSATRSTALRILLRLSMDHIAVENFGFTQKWRQAADVVARSVPDREWSKFCQEVCSSLSRSSPMAMMRWRAISLLGPAVRADDACPLHVQTRALDLRRRLAAAFFFDDLQRPEQRPDDTVNLRSIIDRLEADEFQINRCTDYQELEALMRMLNAALGNASKQNVRTETYIACFHAEIDELAEGLKSMLTRVAPLNKGVHVPRIEAKNAMELVRERLLYQVRIRSMPKIGIFRLDDDAEDADLQKQKQRDLMRDIFLKRDKREPDVKVDADATMAG